MSRPACRSAVARKALRCAQGDNEVVIVAKWPPWRSCSLGAVVIPANLSSSGRSPKDLPHVSAAPRAEAQWSERPFAALRVTTKWSSWRSCHPEGAARRIWSATDAGCTGHRHACLHASRPVAHPRRNARGREVTHERRPVFGMAAMYAMGLQGHARLSLISMPSFGRKYV